MAKSPFDNIAESLSTEGYCVLPDFLPQALCAALLKRVQHLSLNELQPAGVGRQSDYQLNDTVRSDHTAWLNHHDVTEHEFLTLMADFRLAINERLFLGLFDYEAHFAHYSKGAFYQKHLDAFRGRSNRVVSTVFYLNPDWQKDHGGELILYHPDSDDVLETVSPEQGTAVFFLSEDFPHEVKPAEIDRYSIAGWFHVQGSR